MPALPLIGAWRAYKQGIVPLSDVRVWLGIFEVRARRCGDRHCRSSGTVEHELAVLTDLPRAGVAAAIRRLGRAGLVRPRSTGPEAVGDVARLTSLLQEDFQQSLAQVANHRRRIPVPRRVLRCLCRNPRPVLLATVLGHLLRCLYYRERACCPDGRCKASWISAVFRVDVRNVKAARRELVELGMLLMEPTDQRSMNRWGPRVRFNLEWRTPGADARSAGSPPRSAPETCRLPPLKKNRELASRMNNQEPALRRQAGAYAESRVLPPPTLRRVLAVDLQQPERTALLFEEAVRCGFVAGTASDRLKVFAAAERAKACGTRNPCGLFVWLMRRRRWNHITLRDEDAARAAQRRLETGVAEALSGAWSSARRGNGSAGLPVRSACPESARKILADGIRGAHPLLERLAAAFRMPGASG